MTIAALLSALGILIPMVAPKYVIPPASFTLASHVPIFIAMFISIPVAIFVATVTGIGFFFGGYPIIIVFRALTHIIFAVIGSYILSKNPNIINKKSRGILFSLLISLIHGVSEVIIVGLFYMAGTADTLYYERGFILSVILLVGLGTVIHSMVDFTISVMVWRPVQKVLPIPANVKISKPQELRI